MKRKQMMRKNRTNKNENTRHSANLKVVGVCIGFGIGLGVQGYFLGILLGGWLDNLTCRGPLFTLLGVMLAMFISFYELYQALKALDTAEKNSRKEREE